MRKELIDKLTKLYTGESVSTVVFLYVYYLRFKGFVLPVFYPLLVLCFILFQGALYWFICLQRLKGKNIKKCWEGILYLTVDMGMEVCL
ncbi:hypothetical protein AALB39_06505 [Lachnospiraceae bacterium 54-53]